MIDDDVFEHISSAFMGTVPLEQSLNLIMQRTCSLLEVSQTAFFLSEITPRRLRLIASSAGLPEQPVIVVNEGVAGWVARRGQPIALIDPRADPRFGSIPGWVGPMPDAAVPAVAAVPVRTSTGLAGVLVAIDLLKPEDVQPGSPSPGAATLTGILPFLLVMADLVALALENSVILRLQERRTQFIRLLHIIATIPDSESTEGLAQIITNQFCTITQAEVACILLHSAATDELIALGISDTPLGLVQRESGRDHIPLATSGPLLKVFQSGIAMLVGPGPELDELVLLEETGIQSLLAVPLLVEQEIQGVVVLVSTRADAFNDDDLSFISFVSVRLSYALRHKTLADELANLEQQRIDQDARESFITIVAHDLKNVLTTISGSSHLALRKAARGELEYSQKALGIIVAKAAQAIQLVNDMVDVNNVDRGHFRLFIMPVELVELVREEIESSVGLSASHSLDFHTAVETLEIAADGQRLRQVLNNLLTNAIRYSPAGGTIRIDLALVDAAQPLADSELPQAVQLTVTDEGIGISPEDLPHIFDRFYRGRGELVSVGSGLGLYIAAAIIAQHGGRLWVESTLNVGTRFHATLPVSR
jgi:signal transduction histidine kinase